MTGKKETGATWHHTTVILRSDIYRQALERGIDISDACNRALAGLTGNEYHKQQPEKFPEPPPVIIARNGSSPPLSGEVKKGQAQKLHPVINADDPAAPARVIQVKTPVRKAPAEPAIPAPSPSPAAAKETPETVPAITPKKATSQKGRSTESKRKARGDALKKFFSSKIVRTDDSGAAVSKDELYEIFTRFCREQRITPVPEKKAITVALKNQFALNEENVNGTPSWTGVRLK
jgi:hypothetical protein